MGPTSRSMENNGTEYSVGCGGPAQESSEGHDIRNYSCDIFASNAAAFCLCPKNLLEAKLKSFGLMSAEEISGEPNTDCVTWSLEIILVQIYNEREQAGQKKCKMHNLK